METGPYQSLLPLAAAVWQGFQVRRRQALARHQAVMAFEPGDECCRQRSLQEQDDRVLIRKYKVWLVQPVEEGFAVSQKIGIAIGAGPRGAIALVRAARAMALIAGRDHVRPEDVQAILPAVAGHRLNAADTRQGGEALTRRLIESVAVS